MIILIAVAVLFVISPLVRCICNNFHLLPVYSFVDVFNWFRYRKWNEFDLYGIDLYVGMFGHGKTLSMTHRAYNIYKKFGDQVRFISNYTLYGIPYIPLINFNQLVELGEEDDSKYIGTVVLIDEVENVLSHRNFANFPLSLLSSLTQQRKLRLFIMASSQRYFMVDKLFRSITTHVIDCNKFWRFQHCEIFDAWELENAMNTKLLKRLGNIWWFVKNQDFNSYDTSEMIKKGTAEDFISNDESLTRKGLDLIVNDLAISKPSKKFKNLNKKSKG